VRGFAPSRLALLGLLLAFPLVARADLPKEWESGGYKHEGFEVTSDTREQFQGNPTLAIRSTPAIAHDGEANAGTGFRADRYRGKRIRFFAQLKSVDVVDWSGLWMRVSGPPEKDGGQRKRLRFDNMRNRAVKGTTDWTRYDIVLDVPEEAVEIALGFFLVGAGKVWMSTPSLEEVTSAVPVTSSTGSNLPNEPQLDLGK
jgi:hypothetical protein